MELHNDEVPASEVWAVVTENADVRNIDWYITRQASTEQFRFITDWYASNEHELELEVRVTRWYVELPRRRMERADVGQFVEGALLGIGDMMAPIPIRLDIRKFTPTRKEVAG